MQFPKITMMEGRKGRNKQEDRTDIAHRRDLRGLKKPAHGRPDLTIHENAQLQYTMSRTVNF